MMMLVKELTRVNTDLVLGLERAEATLELNSIISPTLFEDTFTSLGEVKSLLDSMQCTLLAPKHPVFAGRAETDPANLEYMISDLRDELTALGNNLTSVIKRLENLPHQKDFTRELKFCFEELSANADVTIIRLRWLMPSL